MWRQVSDTMFERALVIRHAAGATSRGDLVLPGDTRGLVVFAHGSGSSRRSHRNRRVAESLRRQGFGTLLMDLLTEGEERVDRRTGHLRFDIGLLAERLVGAIDTVEVDLDVPDVPIGLFGASTGAAAAVVAAARRPRLVRAVVSRGGRPDLAPQWLHPVAAPTLLVVGGNDPEVLELNRRCATTLEGDHEVRVEVVPGAGHLFEEPGALDRVADLAAGWFTTHLAGQPASR